MFLLQIPDLLRCILILCFLFFHKGFRCFQFFLHRLKLSVCVYQCVLPLKLLLLESGRFLTLFLQFLLVLTFGRQLLRFLLLELLAARLQFIIHVGKHLFELFFLFLFLPQDGFLLLEFICDLLFVLV